MECKDGRRQDGTLGNCVVLIETLWNVKRVDRKEQRRKCIGFNRNIVECKGIGSNSSHSFLRVLIETLWNVKLQRVQRQSEEADVLIETLWNVKADPKLRRKPTKNVLIETLWNVKA